MVPCLERKLHKRMKLKLTTKLMEHYERHCPTSEFRVRCLVPPPPGYKVSHHAPGCSAFSTKQVRVWRQR